ncbi:nucleotidyltransferase family protein [Alteriqipengyuania lutimaris]|uniref:Nucleotidyltransferase family protein n=1 Tax=Alteriqipengyuania lutimaris TaxID=1538146 RepID=A0A395LKV5_9SPHN|nr:nucleotidyltransferase family protein [Alteriqipengyuania lutimaris]MBB3033695.1 molybdenum cofactor cytidylyltransferase [Alteriqipengyuania lutimaris]RDS77319.1 nucleotidyltransferase family protein [Alteriqipengyuania lutimaris]
MPAPDRGTAFILLAAGRSRRFGGEKLTADFRGAPLWEWAAKAAENAGFRHRYIVTGENSPHFARPGWTQVTNPHAEQGIGTSIAAGVEAASGHDRIVIALADMPLITANHLQRLAEADGTVFTRQEDGRPGSPAAFQRSAFALLQTLDGDRGAASLAFPQGTTLAPNAYDTLADVDTPSQLSALSRDVSGQLS